MFAFAAWEEKYEASVIAVSEDLRNVLKGVPQRMVDCLAVLL